MRRIPATTLSLAIAATISATLSIHGFAVQSHSNQPVYSPYPPGLIPSDLPSETRRVNAEIDRSERMALAEWRALPANGGTAMRRQQLLGKLELYDKHLSVNRNQACTFCHMPYTGFSGPISSLNNTVAAYPGSVHYRFGKRKPQAYTYSPYYPVLHYNRTQSTFYGGNFRDLRATGEQAGWELFRGKGMCNTCHLDGTGNTFQNGRRGSGSVSAADAAGLAPLFTDFTSSNLGLPRNPDNPFYYQNKPDRYNLTPNPQGPAFVDFGVGLFLRGLSGTPPDSNWAQHKSGFDGHMQVSTVRNVDMRPYPEFVKSYMHNGYLKSLKEVVHFYNTRDKYKTPASGCPAGTEKVTCWPPAEVPGPTVDQTVGNLGLTDQEEDLIVVFLKTLTDGCTRPYTDFDSFQGAVPINDPVCVAAQRQSAPQ